MDNQAFEMHGETIQSSSKGKEWPKKEVPIIFYSIWITFYILIFYKTLVTESVLKLNLYFRILLYEEGPEENTSSKVLQLLKSSNEKYVESSKTE